MSKGLNKSSVLFKLRSKDLNKEAFLLGTMHVNSESAFKYVDVAEKAIDKCTMYAGEIDLAVRPGPELSNYLLLHNTSLRALYSIKKYERLNRNLKKYFSLELKDYDHFVPFFLLNALNEILLNSGERQALDVYLFEYAIKKGKSTAGLEDFYEHYEVLQNIPYDVQARQLAQVLSHVSKFSKSLKKVSSLYENADLQKMYKMTRQSLGKMRQLMLYDRNRIIADRIIALSSEERLFAACGVSHFWGKFGVLRYLKQANFDIIPISE